MYKTCLTFVFLAAALCSYMPVVSAQEDTESESSKSDTQGEKEPGNTSEETGEDTEEPDQTGEADEEPSTQAPESPPDSAPAEEEPLELPPPPPAGGDTSGEKEPVLETPPDFQLDTGSDDSLVPPWEKKGEEPEDEAVEEWEDRNLQVFEIHGYFRTRGAMFHKFPIRNDEALFSQPLEENDRYVTDCRESAWGDPANCSNATLAGGNLKLRLEPRINVSEEVRVMAQLDFLDNLVLGSTPESYDNGQYSVQNGTVDPGRFTDSRQSVPTYERMISVRRAWAEVMTPLGEVRFGRMGDHWGLGMMHNNGADIYQDYGDSIDRIMFATKIAGIVIAPGFDFINEGPTSAAGPRPWSTYDQPFDVSQMDDAYQLMAILAYKQDRDEQEAMLRRGDVVINTGLYFQYRSQVLTIDPIDSENDGIIDPIDVDDHQEENYNFVRRDYWGVIPDLWWQLLYEHLHVELEFVFIYGDVKNVSADDAPEQGDTDVELLQYGGVLQVDYGLLNDQLRLGLEFGLASGDDGVEGMRPPTNMNQNRSAADNYYSLYTFNPAYHIDLILFRNVLGSVTGAYYFNPWVRYDFLYSRAGKQLGAQLDIVYSRASEPSSTIGNDGNMGVEIDIGVFYRSEDMFFAGLQYGVLFALGAFEGYVEDTDFEDNDLSTAQTVQGLLGVSF